MVSQKTFLTDSAILIKAKEGYEGIEAEVSKSVNEEK
jgi:hypothetical protein